MKKIKKTEVRIKAFFSFVKQMVNNVEKIDDIRNELFSLRGVHK